MPQESLEARIERAQRRLAEISQAKASSPPSPNGGVPSSLEERLLSSLEERLLAAISASEANVLRLLLSDEGGTVLPFVYVSQLRHLLAAKVSDGDGSISGGGINAGRISAGGPLTSNGALIGPCSPSDQPTWQRLRQATDPRSSEAISFRPVAASPQGGSDSHSSRASSVTFRVSSPSTSDAGDSAHGGSACANSQSLSPQLERDQTKRRLLGRVEEEPSDDPGREWELVEGDPDVNALLKDVRGRIDEYYVKNARYQPTIADFEAEGTLYVQLISATGLVAAGTLMTSDDL